MEDRIVEFETRIAFQENELQKLASTALVQARQIFQLERALEALGERLAALLPSLPSPPGQEPPPPHY